jgi:adenylosuccinate lyase
MRHLQRTEVREAEEPFRTGAQKGSSAMPHKRNPVKSEQLCGLARVLRANLQAGLENVALWHERDISHSSVERVVFPDSMQLAYYVTVKLTSLVEGMVAYPERMRENLDASHGLVFSQPVLLALVEAGLTRDDAYRLVQRNAMRTWEEHRPFVDVLRDDPEVLGALGEDRLHACFDLESALVHAGRAVDLLDDPSAS